MSPDDPSAAPSFGTAADAGRDRLTGATRGIGAKLALALSKAGADVILVQRNTTNTATKDLIEQNGGKADIVVCDLASKDDVAKLIPHVVNDLKRTLDIVVNCGTSPLACSIHWATLCSRQWGLGWMGVAG